MQPYTSSSPSSTIDVQSSTETSTAVPLLSEITTPDKQASAVSPSTSRTKSTPSPAGIVAPVKLNPTTVLALLETVKPASAAAPPPAPVIVTPSTLN